MEAKAPLAGGLADRLARSATGFGAVIDGVLDIRTVCDGENIAAALALRVLGVPIVRVCRKVDCTCCLEILAGHFPDARVVAVSVEVVR